MTLLYGMIHLPSLRNDSMDLDGILNYATQEASVLSQTDFDGLILENFGDTPFAKSRVSDKVLCKLSIIARQLRIEFPDMEIGLNILRNAAKQAMTIASVTELDFIRCNVWEGAYITDQGIIEGAAFEVMNEKNRLGSDVKVFADVFVKHATPMSDFSIEEAAEQALGRGGADKIIVSGRSTGDPVGQNNLDSLNNKGIYPLIGSGSSLDNMESYVGKVSGLIVGTAIKGGVVTSSIDRGKAKRFAEKYRELLK